MIVFITDNATHETDAEIIKTLKKITNKFLVITPDISEIDLQKIAFSEEKNFILINPTIQYSQYLQKSAKFQIRAINPIFTTLFLKISGIY
jgi:fructoselysine-6-P-deglycase FrlB-like protein